MDMLFFFAACLGLAETVDLFMGKDFLILWENRWMKRITIRRKCLR